MIVQRYADKGSFLLLLLFATAAFLASYVVFVHCDRSDVLRGLLALAFLLLAFLDVLGFALLIVRVLVLVSLGHVKVGVGAAISQQITRLSPIMTK